MFSIIELLNLEFYDLNFVINYICIGLYKLARVHIIYKLIVIGQCFIYTIYDIYRKPHAKLLVLLKHLASLYTWVLCLAELTETELQLGKLRKLLPSTSTLSYITKHTLFSYPQNSPASLGFVKLMAIHST